jgi:hypothetical protein
VRLLNAQETIVDKELEVMTDEVIYRAMLDARPSLVEAVADMVRYGQSPAAIENEMRRRFGGIQMVRNVRHCAEHLARQTS